MTKTETVEAPGVSLKAAVNRAFSAAKQATSDTAGGESFSVEASDPSVGSFALLMVTKPGVDSWRAHLKLKDRSDLGLDGEGTAVDVVFDDGNGGSAVCREVFTSAPDETVESAIAAAVSRFVSGAEKAAA